MNNANTDLSASDRANDSRLLRDQLELTNELAAEAIRFRRAFQVEPTDWTMSRTYKGMSFNLQMKGDSPVFVLLHETKPDEVVATFSSPQEAAKAAIEYHRTHNLTRPRYEVQRQPFIGWEYEPGFESDSPKEIAMAFEVSAPAFRGGELLIWDRHEHACAAYLHWTFESDPYRDVVTRSARHVYLDQEIAAVAQRIDQRERISMGRRMEL